MKAGDCDKTRRIDRGPQRLAKTKHKLLVLSCFPSVITLLLRAIFDSDFSLPFLACLTYSACLRTFDSIVNLTFPISLIEYIESELVGHSCMTCRGVLSMSAQWPNEQRSVDAQVRNPRDLRANEWFDGMSHGSLAIKLSERGLDGDLPTGVRTDCTGVQSISFSACLGTILELKFGWNARCSGVFALHHCDHAMAHADVNRCLWNGITELRTRGCDRTASRAFIVRITAKAEYACLAIDCPGATTYGETTDPYPGDRTRPRNP